MRGFWMTKMPELDVLLFQYILLILEQLSFQKMLSLPLTLTLYP